jgi:hypothetical protein
VLTFTPSNWNVWQPVIVFGVDDVDVEHNGTRIDLTSLPLAPRTVRVDIVDDDLLFVDPKYIDTCHGETSVAKVKLNNAPFSGAPHNGSMVVTFTSVNGYVSMNPPVLVFDQGNYSGGTPVDITSDYSPQTDSDKVMISAPGQRSIFIDMTLRPGNPGLGCALP